MMKSVTSIASLMLLVFVLPSVCTAQEVPQAVKKEILAYLKGQPDCTGEYMEFDVHSAKVGPNKSGFIGSCRYGGGISVFYEKTSHSLRKLFQVAVPMNFEFFVSEDVHNGYYDIIVQGGSGSTLYVSNYRWNGRRYVKRKGGTF